MKYKANIDFESFRDFVVRKMVGSVACDVREALGQALSKVSHRSTQEDESVSDLWAAWLFDIDELATATSDCDFHAKSGERRDLANFVSKLKTNGSGSKKLAAAFYYRLHYNVDDLSHAELVDEAAFGSQEKLYKLFNVESIFQPDQIHSETLTPTYPRKVKLTDAHQSDREEYGELKSLLPHKDSNFVGITAIVHGTGGYGKTSLVEEFCQDTSVREIFTGGIYWFQFGVPDSDNGDQATNTNSVRDAIQNMLSSQYNISDKSTDGKKSKVEIDYRDDEDAIKSLFNYLPVDKPMLIVADDLWAHHQAKWIDYLPPNAALVATTRKKSLRSLFDHPIKIKELSDGLSEKILLYGLEDIPHEKQDRIIKIASKFDGWPLVLNLANATFRDRQKSGEGLEETISDFEILVEEKNFTSWDDEEVGEKQDELRRKFVGHCVRIGLSALPKPRVSGNPRPIYEEALLSMGVFPEDTDIPFDVLSDYWIELTKDETGEARIDQNRAVTIRNRLNDLSFFRECNLENKTIRIHDVFLSYFRKNHRPDGLKFLHVKLTDSIKIHCTDGWETLSRSHQYGWKHLLYHLEAQGLQDEADDLRTDFQWLKAKLHVVGITQLHRSYIPFPKRSDARDIGRTIQLSLPALQKQTKAFAHQMFGILGHGPTYDRLKTFLEDAKNDESFLPVIRTPHLNPIGDEFLRIIPGNSVYNAFFSPKQEKILTIQTNKVVRIWDSETGNPIQTICGKFDDVVFSPNKKILLRCSYNDSYIEIRRAPDFNVSKNIYVDKSRVYFSPDSSRFVTISENKSFCLWDSESAELISSAKIRGNKFAPFCFSADSWFLAIALTKNTVTLWSAVTGKTLRLFNNHNGQINSITISPSDNTIITASSDKTTIVCDVNSKEPLLARLKHSASVTRAIISPDGSRIITQTEDGSVFLWSTTDYAKIKELSDSNIRIDDIIFSPDSKRIVAPYYYTHKIHLLCARNGTLINSSNFHSKHINSISFSPNGQFFATASHDKTACIWDADTGVIRKTFKSDKRMVVSGCFSSDSRYFITSSLDDVVRVWKLDGNRLKETKPHKNYVFHVNCSTSGKRVWSGSSDGTAVLWDRKTYSPIKTFRAQDSPVMNSAFSMDGSRLTISTDRKVTLWNGNTGRYVKCLGYHNQYPRGRFSPQAERLITYTRTSFPENHLWNGHTGSHITELDTGEKRVIEVCFTLKSEYFLIALEDGCFNLHDGVNGRFIRAYRKSDVRTSKSSMFMFCRYIDCAFYLNGMNFENYRNLLGRTLHAPKEQLDVRSDKTVCLNLKGEVFINGKNLIPPNRTHHTANDFLIFDGAGVLVILSYDNEVSFWNIENENFISSLYLDAFPTRAVAWKNSLVVGLSDGRVVFLDVPRCT